MSNWKNDPRSYAVELVEAGLVSADTMILVLLGYMSHDDVRGALDANELSPRFDDKPNNGGGRGMSDAYEQTSGDTITVTDRFGETWTDTGGLRIVGPDEINICNHAAPRQGMRDIPHTPAAVRERVNEWIGGEG